MKKTELLSMAECRACRKKKLAVMMDINGICLYCRRSGIEYEESVEIQKKRRTTHLMNAIANIEDYTDEEIEMIIEEGKKLRELSKKKHLGDEK